MPRQQSSSFTATTALCLLCVAMAMCILAVNAQGTTTSSSSTASVSSSSSSSSSTAAAAATTASSSTGPSANGAGNETDGGSTTLGVFSGLAVFALVGYRVYLDYKDRKGAQLMNSVEQPHAGSQL